jgi:hypothetical protein
MANDPETISTQVSNQDSIEPKTELIMVQLIMGQLSWFIWFKAVSELLQEKTTRPCQLGVSILLVVSVQQI